MVTRAISATESGSADNHFVPSVALGNNPIRIATAIVSTLPLLALGSILVVLFFNSLPAIKYNGFHFLTSKHWNPGNFYANPVTTNGVTHPILANYGAWPLIVGTLLSSLIAITIALPLSVGAALIVAKSLGPRLRNLLGVFFELLAGIPSVIFGLWGALTLGPLLARDVYPLLARHIPNVILLKYFRGTTGSGEGLLTSGIVLAIMIVPIIASTTRDLFLQVPKLTEDGASALGLTQWEVTRNVTFPWVSAGIIGATVLGLARALGETMAVAMISGSVLGSLPTNIYSTYTTIAATIVSQLDSALTDATGLAVDTLAEVALIIMVVTLLTNVGARILIKKVSTTSLPVGRGI